MIEHLHEGWQIRTAPDETSYCAACGATVGEVPC